MNNPCTERPQRHSSDEGLIKRAKAGDILAFEQLYARHHSQALRVATRICGHQDAEDAAQAAFTSVWRNLDGFRPDRASAKTWLISIVRHRAIDMLRAKPRVAISSIDARPEGEDPVRTETLVAQREESRAVRSAVADLPEAQRQVIELAYFSELSQSEIARKLKLPIGTVKGRTRLGMKKLPSRLAGPTGVTA